MIENIFKKGYAECLIARLATTDGSKGEAVGLALVRRTLFFWWILAEHKYFFTYSTWLGVPGLYVCTLVDRYEFYSRVA